GLPGLGLLTGGVLGDELGVGAVGLVAPAARQPGVLDAGRVGDTDEPPGAGEVGGGCFGVGAGGLHTEMQVMALGVSVGPGQQCGVALGVVGEGGLVGPPAGEQQAGVQRVLGNVDADEGGRGTGAHGAAPL